MIKAIKKALQQSVMKLYPVKSVEPNCAKVINGSYQANQCTINEMLTINGEGIVDHVIFKNLITINGKLSAANTIFEAELSVNGSLILNSSTLKNNVYFSGNLVVTDCFFWKEIVLLTQRATFKNCTINQIIIHKIPIFNATQIVYLYDTIIENNITFESGCGQLILDKTSQIKGSTSGGGIAETYTSF